MSSFDRLKRDANENLQIVRWDLRVHDAIGSYQVYPYCDSDEIVLGTERDATTFQQAPDATRRQMAGFALEAAQTVLKEG